MDFHAFAKDSKPLLSKALLSYLTTQPVLTKVSPWGEDLRGRLKGFVTQGKLMRGTLVLLGYKMFGGTDDTAIPAAAALELFHTSFLIHDDIMDQDELRRGLKTFYKQYQELSEKQGLTNTKHTGESLGICAGDIGFFLGFDLLNTINASSEIKQNLFQTICHELVLVGLGQMQDVALGAKNTTPTEEEILHVYQYKTARYTFSLPLMAGAILAGANEKQLKIIEKAGESLGIIFQIKDDELGIFGTEEEIGKPIGSDIRENKKTLFYYYLFQKADQEMKERLKKIFDNPSLSKEDIEYVRECIKKTGVEKIIEKKMNTLEKESSQMIENLTIKNQDKTILRQLLDFIVTRRI